MKKVIDGHNKAILKNAQNPEENQPKKMCNCRNEKEWPLEGGCLQNEIVYQATVTTRGVTGTTSNDLKWNVHVLELVKKASCRLYFLRQLKRSQIMPAELILFYITCIRSILEYACPVFHRALPGYLSEDLERLQKRALRIIYSGMSYNQALEFSGLATLFKRREEISSKLFNEVVGDPGHTLHKLLPSKNPANYFLRRNRNFALPLCKTNRCKKSFIFSHVFCA